MTGSKRFRNRIKQLIQAFVALFLSIVFGICGYIIIEDYTFIDALYMVSMIVSTVGFGEVKALSDAGRVFSSLFFLFNICLFAYVVAVLSKYLYEGELKDIFTKYMLGREVRKMKDHVIICGLGRNGYRAAVELHSENVPFVVIDENEEIIKKLFGENNHSFNYVIGDATEEHILKEAGIERARSLIACIPRDATNVFVTLSARELNPKLKIIARAINNSAESKLRKAGADFVVNPDEIGGSHMANLVQRPEIIEFLNLLSGEGELKLKLDEYSFADYKEQYKGKTIFDMGVKKICRVTFVCLKSLKKGYVFNPNSKTIMREGDNMIILGTPDDIAAFKQEFTYKK